MLRGIFSSAQSSLQGLYYVNKNGVCPALEHAAKTGDVDKALHLLSIPRIREAATTNNNAPLRLATKFKHPKIVQALLKIEAVRCANTWNSTRPLIYMAAYGHVDVVKQLLTFPDVIDSATVWSNEALKLALDNGHSNIAKALLALKTVRNTNIDYNKTPLIYMLKSGHIEAAKHLLTYQDIMASAEDSDNKALVFALRKGFHDIVKVLLTSEAVRHTNIDWHESPLIYMLNNGHTEAAKHALLTYPDVMTTATDKNNLALILALRKQLDGAVRQLLDIKAVRTAKTGFYATPLIYMLECGNTHYAMQLLAHQDVRASAAADDNKALVLSLQKKLQPITEELLKIKAVRTTETWLYGSPLKYTARHGHADAAKILLSYPEARAQLTTNHCEVLCEAARHERIGVMRELLKFKALRSAEIHGESAFIHMVRWGYTHAALEFLAYSDIEAEADQNHALRLANELNGHDLVRELFKIKAVRTTRTRGTTPLIYILKHGWLKRPDPLDAVKQLLNYQDVRETAGTIINGDSALSLATEKCFTDIIRVLLPIRQVRATAAANLNNVLQWACHHKLGDIVQELIKIPTVRATRTNNHTTLAYMIRCNFTDITQQLLAYNDVRESAAADSNNALHWAIEQNAVELARSLASVQVVRNTLVDEKPPLIRALERNRLDIARLLLAHDDIRASAGANNNEALYWAAHHGLSDIANALLRIQAVQDSNLTSRDFAILRAGINSQNVPLVARLLRIPSIKKGAFALLVDPEFTQKLYSIVRKMTGTQFSREATSFHLLPRISHLIIGYLDDFDTGSEQATETATPYPKKVKQLKQFLRNFSSKEGVNHKGYNAMLPQAMATERNAMVFSAPQRVLPARSSRPKRGDKLNLSSQESPLKRQRRKGPKG